MPNHNYQVPGKRDYRLRTRLWAEDRGSLIWKADSDKNQLVGAFCDLMGEQNDEVPHALCLWEGSKFIGVDTDAKFIEPLAAKYPRGDQYDWITGNVFNLLNGDSRLDDVVFLNLDLEEPTDADLEDRLDYLKHWAGRAVRRFQEAALTINLMMDDVPRRGKKRSECLRNSTTTIANALSGYLEGRRIDPDQLLPKTSLKKIDDTTFTGIVGAYDIYKSKTYRMANLRLMLR